MDLLARAGVCAGRRPLVAEGALLGPGQYTGLHSISQRMDFAGPQGPGDEPNGRCGLQGGVRRALPRVTSMPFRHDGKSIQQPKPVPSFRRADSYRSHPHAKA
jgi:hypothetical protein